MKRYLVFAWNHYEAMGGWNDFMEDYKLEPMAEQRAAELVGKLDPREKIFDCSHVVDKKTGKIVQSWYSRGGVTL